MTRRSFCFLFGAGVAGLALLRSAAPPVYQFTGLTSMGETVPTTVLNSVPFNDAQVVAHRIYTGNGRGAYSHIATVPAVGAPLTMHFDGGLRFSAGGKPVAPTYLAPAYRGKS